MTKPLREQRCIKCNGPLFPELHPELHGYPYNQWRDGFATLGHALRCGLADYVAVDGWNKILCCCGEVIRDDPQTYQGHLKTYHPWKRLLVMSTLQEMP